MRATETGTLIAMCPQLLHPRGIWRKRDIQTQNKDISGSPAWSPCPVSHTYWANSGAWEVALLVLSVKGLIKIMMTGPHWKCFKWKENKFTMLRNSYWKYKAELAKKLSKSKSKQERKSVVLPQLMPIWLDLKPLICPRLPVLSQTPGKQSKFRHWEKT